MRVGRPLAGVRTAAGRRLKASLPGQVLDRGGEIKPGDAHHEVERIAMRLTAEAMKEPLVVADRERRRLLLVKGAEADMLAAPARKPDVRRHDRGDRAPRAHLVKERFRERHSPLENAVRRRTGY